MPVAGWDRPPNRLLLRMMVTTLLAERNQKRLQSKLAKLSMEEIDKVIMALEKLSTEEEDQSLEQIWPSLKKMTDLEWAQHRAEEIAGKLRKERQSQAAREFVEKKEAA